MKVKWSTLKKPDKDYFKFLDELEKQMSVHRKKSK